MKVNEGKFDRIIRVCLGVILFFCVFFARGIFQITLGILGLMSIISGAIGFCGIYTILGINSCKPKK
jgi:hypothetical protein